MSSIRPAQDRTGFEIVALFRYDPDPAGVIADSALILIPTGSADVEELLFALEQAATKLADILAKGEPPRRVYAFKAPASNLPQHTTGFVCR